MTLRFDFFYENADKEYFLALLQKLAIACNVDLCAESSAEFVSIFASAESSEILGKFADILQAEVPHSLYFKLKEVNLCNEVRGEKIALNARSDIFSVSDINAIKDIKNPRFCEIDSANSASCGDFSRSRSPHFLDEPFVLSASLTSHERENSSTILEFASCKKNAESSTESQGGLPRSHLLARNDEILDSSLRLRSAQNNKIETENDNLGLDSALLKSTLKNLCDALAKGQSVALNTSRGEILLSTKSKDFDFILANDIATLNLYTRATQDEISALASFEKPLIELAIKEVFAREIGAKSAKFILPYDIILCCLSSMLLERDIAFVRAKFAESKLKSSAFFEIVVGQNGYFLHKNYLDSANFAEFLNINFGAQSSAKNSVIASEQGERGNPQNIIIYLSLQNPSIFACAWRKIANIAFDKNPKNILQKISHLENGDKLIANFKKAFEARYEAILALDSAPQWTQNLLDIFECAAMILGAESKNAESSKNAIFDLAQSYLRDIGPKIDFKSVKLNSSLDMQCRTQSAESTLDSAFSQNLNKNNLVRSTQNSPASWCKKSESKGVEVPPADFLLEAEKRGSPPKSEKRQLLARRGSGEGGAALLREETSEISSKRGAESTLDSANYADFSQGGLPRRFCESARNDEFIKDSSATSLPQNDNMGLDSSLRLRFAQNDKIEKENDNLNGFAESINESQNGLPRSHSLARNDEILDYSLRKCFAQNDKIGLDSADSQNLQGGLPREQSSLAMTKNQDCAESANKTQQTIEEIAVEVAEFLGDFGCETGLKSAKHSKSSKSPQDEPKTKLQTNDLIYDELRTIRSIISFTLAGSEPEVIAFGIIESLVDYLVLLFREAQNQFGAKNIAIAGDLFANKVFFDKITKKIPTDFKLIFPKYLDISSARRASCKT